MNREKLLARKRRYRERHLEQERERNRRWREANKEHLAEKGREWRLTHPGYTIAGVKRWRANNPDLHAASARACACNRRAKAAGAPGHISRADVTALWERQPVCAGCGNGRGVDHIIDFRHGGTNTPDNIQNLCRTCNEMKAAKLTGDDVRAMRRDYNSGLTDQKVLAGKYGVSRANVWLIVTGKTWADVV